MNDLRRPGDRTVPVIQGEFQVSDDPAVMMTTILGSCVAVCLNDPSRAIGGMNHYLLARGDAAQGAHLRYGAHAMELLINALLKKGASRDRLQAKAFGGAHVTTGSSDIGETNAAFALDYLKQEGIPCLSQSLGGLKARRLQFRPVDGTVRMMFVADGPTKVEIPVVRPPPPPAIDLF